MWTKTCSPNLKWRTYKLQWSKIVTLRFKMWSIRNCDQMVATNVFSFFNFFDFTKVVDSWWKPTFYNGKKSKIKYIFFQFLRFFLINNHKIGEIGPKRKNIWHHLFEGTKNHPNEQMEWICMKINHNCPNGQAKFQKHMTLFCYEQKGVMEMYMVT